MKVTPSLCDRMAGLCSLCTLTIAGYRLKIVWWWLQIPPDQQKAVAVAGSIVIGVLALAAAIGSWRNAFWAYVLVFVLTTIENVSAVIAHYSLPLNSRAEGFVGLAISGIPLFVAMLAAVVLVLARRSTVEKNA